MKRHSVGRGLALGSVCVAAVALNGCALLPVAALGVAGNVADIGSAAFSAGTEVFNAGKLESFEFCTFEQGNAAVLSTLNDLRLLQTASKFEKSKSHFRFKDRTGATVDIDLQGRTPALCGFRIDVGYFGSEAYARLLLKSVRARLPLYQGKATTKPVNPADLDAPRRYDRAFQTDNLDR